MGRTREENKKKEAANGKGKRRFSHSNSSNFSTKMTFSSLEMCLLGLLLDSISYYILYLGGFGSLNKFQAAALKSSKNCYFHLQQFIFGGSVSGSAW